MEQIAARGALLVGKLLLGGDDGVADRTLNVSFQSTHHISAEGVQAIYDRAVLKKSQ